MTECRLRNAIMSIVLASLTLVFSCVSVNAAQYREVAWVELMPADDLDALLNPPESIFDIQDGSSEDTLDSLGESEGIDEQRYFEALASTRVVSEFDNTKIKIPGFVVPLEMKEGTTVTEFLLVPFFGACLHQPPPPPNQTRSETKKRGCPPNPPFVFLPSPPQRLFLGPTIVASISFDE